MSSPFQFGAGANFSFQGVEAAEVERLRQELAIVNAALAAAHAESGRLGDELAAARAESDRHLTRESTARGCFNSVRREYAILERKFDELKKKPMDDYNRIIELQREKDETSKTIRDLREQLSSSQKQVANIQAQLEKSDQDVHSRQKQLEQSRATIEKLKQDLEHEKAAGAERDAMLNKAYADLKAAQNARLTALRSKDDMELEKKDTELQFSDLHKQFEEERIRNEELEGKLHQIEQLDADNEGLQADIERLHEMIAEHDRTLIVKDERIAHLEAQYQKERQRNLNAADAAAAAAATSPIDEVPPTLPGLAESLADELDAASDEYDEFHYEQNDYSDITFTADIAPIEPSRPDYSFTVGEAASVAPVDAAIPTLSFSVEQAGSVPPIDAVKPELTLRVNQAGSVAPVDVVMPKLTLSVDVAGSVAPIERQNNTTSASAQTDAQHLTTEFLHIATHEISPITPAAIATNATSTQTDAPQLTSSVIDHATITVSPGQAEPQRTTVSLAPIKVTHEEAPLDARPSETSTASTGAQTAEIFTGPTKPAPQPTNTVVLDSKPHKLGLLQTILPILAAVLAFFCLMLYTEVQAWRTANGVGFGYGHGRSYSRSGAYGNGRYLFGFIPIAMDVGNNWWSELVAKYSSLGITAFEEWAGISYEPLY